MCPWNGVGYCSTFHVTTSRPPSTPATCHRPALRPGRRSPRVDRKTGRPLYADGRSTTTAPRSRVLPDRHLAPVIVRRLVIVSRDHPDVYEFLREYFEDRKDVSGVILDRRSISTPLAGPPRKERRLARRRPQAEAPLTRVSHHPRMMRRHASVCPRPDPTHPIGDRHRRGPRGALGLLGPHPSWAIHRDPRRGGRGSRRPRY